MCCFDPGDCNVPYFAIRSVPYFFCIHGYYQKEFRNKDENFKESNWTKWKTTNQITFNVKVHALEI